MGGALQKWASAGKQRVGNRRRQAEGSGALAARACFVNSVNKTRACSECLEKPPKTQPSSVVPPAPWFRPPRGSGAALQECRFQLSVERREMGHVAGLGPEYRKYLRRLEAGPVALPEPADSQAQRG